MNDVQAPPTPATDLGMPDDRSCTRCGGRQHLIAGPHGMGKYRCDVCEMVVGFDLEAPEPEFMIDRGQARLYTKDVFGGQIASTERRVTPRV